MKLGDDEIAALAAGARRVRDSAHVPYSGFAVGCAVVAADDRVFFGCNVESASYGLTLCAERAAIASAVAAGACPIRAAVVVADASPPAAPCGACRQWLAELGGPDTEVITISLDGKRARHTVRDLLPEAFTLEATPCRRQKGARS